MHVVDGANGEVERRSSEVEEARSEEEVGDGWSSSICATRKDRPVS